MNNEISGLIKKHNAGHYNHDHYYLQTAGVCMWLACIIYRGSASCVLLAAATERPANKLQCHSKLTTIKHKRARETACLNSNNMIYCVLMQNNHNSNNITHTHAALLCSAGGGRA